VVWTHADEYKAENLPRVLAEGARLIVIDPRLTYWQDGLTSGYSSDQVQIRHLP
jgi:hypothetical protein